ncbi:MAG: hypothetical protein MO853_09750 [Candidatus Protistobacter heckmanni]|nr:hypothetical protein [Candidatus Protistobacter heckmanni]
MENKAIDEAIALSKLSVASHQNFATNGVKVTPQAQALVREIQAGNPGMSLNDAARYAIRYIESGAALPQAGIATQSSALVKLVSKGETFCLPTATG